MTQTSLAGTLGGRAQSTISTWIAGRASPTPDVVFEIEHLLELPAGHLSQHLGYIPTGAVPAAISTDSTLNAAGRRAMLSHYTELVNDTSSS